MTFLSPRYLFLLFSIFSSTICFSSLPRDFIFIAEIPTYTPFKTQLNLEELLQKEAEYIGSKKSWNNPTPCLEEKMFVIDCGAKATKKVTRGRFTPYDQKKNESSGVLNVETDEQNIRSVIDLFSKESFGITDEESLEESAEALRLIILANRIKSIVSVKNQSLKVPYDYAGALILRGVWEPQWFQKTKKGKGFKYTPITFKDVRGYLRACLRKIKDPSLTNDEKEKWLKEIHTLLSEENKTSGFVPYHELREHLRIAKTRNLFVETFTSTHPEARLYEATHDSDLLRLRIKRDKTTSTETVFETGLYSHYLEILREKRAKQLSLPNVLSTGHRIAYEQDRFTDRNHFAWLYQVIEEDRYTKAVASKVDFRAAYISEPNCLYLIPRGKTSIQQSYLSLPNGDHLIMGEYNKYDPCESMAVMVEMYKQNSNVTVHFDPIHPVLMKTPDRMLKSKTSKTSINLEELGQYNSALDVFSNVKLSQAFNLSSCISQSPFAYRDYAITLYRQFAFNGGTRINYSFFRSIIPTIFNYYDLKNHSFQGDGSFQRPQKLNFTYTNKNSETDPEVGPLVKKINAIKLQESAAKQLPSLIILMNEMYGQNTGEVIVNIACAMEGARADHYEAFFSESSDRKSLRTFPKQAIKQSPEKKPEEPIKKEKGSTKVKRELFGDTSPSAPKVKKEVKIQKQKNKPESVNSFLTKYLKKDYDRKIVTRLLSYFSASDLAKRISRDTSIISKLKNPQKYGPNHPSAKKVWGLFHNKSIEDLETLGFSKITLQQLAQDLGYKVAV
tara:strand:+ start:2018 stop:4375 length:2358 start_codon:yes stop_codon:yes gene_type:complete